MGARQASNHLLPVKTLFLAVIVIALIPASVVAWIRLNYTDSQIVSRAQLIITGHIKPDTLTLVDHKTGTSWEHHGVLIVIEVLKGHAAEKEIPIITHYGLEPVVGGEAETKHLIMHRRSFEPDYPKDVVEIFDTGNDSSSIAKHINRKHAHGVSKCRDCGALVPWQECEGHKCKIEKDMGKANDGEEGPEKKRARVN